MGKGPALGLMALVTISPSETTICFPSLLALPRNGFPVTLTTESTTVLPMRLAKSELNFPSNNTATGILLTVKLRKSSSPFTLLISTIAGELITRLFVSVASNMVFLIPGAFTVSMLDGNMGNTLSKLFEMGLGLLAARNG